jgi:hypothetical protein
MQVSALQLINAITDGVFRSEVINEPKYEVKVVSSMAHSQTK